MSLSDSSGSDDTSLSWQLNLQSHRLLMTERVEYRKISASLQNALIFDREDNEEIMNQYRNPTNKSQIAIMVDKLLLKGEENYNKFLDEVLGPYYPGIYAQMTGKEPPKREMPWKPDIIPTMEDVTKILIERLDHKKVECQELVRSNMIIQRESEEKTREISLLQSEIQEHQRRSERYGSMERDMSALKDVVDQVKNENYKVCMRLVDINEENSRLREHNMALRVENDKAKVEIRKMESTVNSERSVSVRLRTRLETGPSVKVIRTLQQEIDELKLKLAQSNQEIHSFDNDVDTRLQILQSDKDEAIQMYAEATEKLNKLRDEFNSTETLRDKYLEENERLRLQISALTDDCEMYKTRRDAVWQQLQEVEKERDQLMKERNEAQLTAQTHMDEKTKYRAEIRKLEELHDKLSHQLREKETDLRSLKNQVKKNAQFSAGPPDGPRLSSDADSSTTTGTTSIPGKKTEFRSRAFITKYYPEFCVKSEFDSAMDLKSVTAGTVFPEIPLAANYGRNCQIYDNRPNGDPRRRRQVIRKNRNDSKQTHAGSMHQKKTSESHSRTSSAESSNQRKEDTSAFDVDIDAETVQKCVKLIGGNQSGIFINQVLDSSMCADNCTSLNVGMQLLKVSSPRRKRVTIKKWTLEYANNIIHNLEGVITLTVEQRHKEYQDLKELMKNSRMTGDSFYVRANFKWNKEEMLNFNKYEVLHVVSTQPHTDLHWLACKVDPYNGNNASKCDVIPSSKYCAEHPQTQDQIITAGRRFTEPNLYPSSGNVDKEHVSSIASSFRTAIASPAARNQCCSYLVIGRPETSYEAIGNAYTIVKAVQSAKAKPRPCLLLPQSLSKVLSFKLTTIAEPLLFDFPVPEAANCNIISVKTRLYDHDVVSFNSVSDDSQEIVTTNAVKKIADMGKHCILNINENCISIKEYLRKLQAEDIYPIIVFLQTEKPRTVKVYVEEDKSKTNVVIQDMILTGEQLKRFACNFVTVNLDRCNRIEDAVQNLMERVADETNRIVWQEDEEEICI